MQKRVVLLSTEFLPAPGGIGSHANQLSLALKNLGWEITIFTRQEYCTDQESEDFNESYHSKIVKLHPAPRLLGLLKEMRNLFFYILKYKPDVLIGTGRHAVWFAVFLAKITFRPSIAIAHGGEVFKKKSWLSNLVNKLAYSSATTIISVSNFTKGEILKSKITPRNIEVIHNGADQDLFDRLSSEEIDIFKKTNDFLDKKIIITVGTLSNRKGQKVMIRSMPYILKEIPNAHYLCIGRSILKDSLDELITELDVKNNVHLLGEIPDEELVQWLNCSDIFAMTSIVSKDGDFEGYGIAVIEAAFCGKPAVVSNNSGLTEAVIDEVTALVVPQNDPEKTADAVIRLLGDEQLLKQMGEQANKRAIEEQSWTSRALEYQNVMLDLIKR